MPHPNQLLLDAFHHHGRPEAKIEGDWIVMDGYPPARAAIYRHTAGHSLVNLQLDIEIALDDGRVIGESAGGLGVDEAAATENAFAKLAASSLHALLCAFYDYPVDDQTDLQEWEINGTRWEVFRGPCVGMHLSLDGSTDRSPVQAPPPDGFDGFIEQEIRARTLDHDTHWVRFFYAHQNGQTSASEVLWDNDIWQESQVRMARLNWPRAEGFNSLRCFTLLRKKGAAKQRGSADNVQAIERALSQMFEYCGRNPYADHEAIIAHLVSSGVPALLAERVLLFGPIAFASLVLGEAYPPVYLLSTEKYGLITRRLDQEPIFMVGMRFAMAAADNADQRVAFMAIAGRDALMNAANQALNNGSKLEDMQFSPPIMFFQEYEDQIKPEEAARAIPLPQRAVLSQSNPDPKKPWWKIW